MTLTKGQGHRSRSTVQKLAKIYKMGHISDAISPTDFILGTKVQPNKAHSIDYSCITFAEFLFCTPIPETLSISLKAAKEIRIFFYFRKLIRTFSIQNKLRTGYAKKIL